MAVMAAERLLANITFLGKGKEIRGLHVQRIKGEEEVFDGLKVAFNCNVNYLFVL